MYRLPYDRLLQDFVFSISIRYECLFRQRNTSNWYELLFFIGSFVIVFSVIINLKGSRGDINRGIEHQYNPGTLMKTGYLRLICFKDRTWLRQFSDTEKVEKNEVLKNGTTGHKVYCVKVDYTSFRPVRVIWKVNTVYLETVQVSDHRQVVTSQLMSYQIFNPLMSVFPRILLFFFY